MRDRKTEYDIKYQKEHVKRIPFNVSKEYYENVLKPTADEMGLPMNTFIRTAIDYYIEHEY